MATNNIIKYPSDFLIRINSVNGKDGQEIPLDDIYIKFTFTDSCSNTYTAIWDPFGQEGLNTFVNSEDNKLHIKFEDYNLIGDLQWKMDTRTEDTRFGDGYWNIYGSFKPANIRIVK